MRIFIVFLFQYPLGWLMHFLVRGRLVRHLFTTVIGIFIQLYVYRADMVHVLLMTGVAYLMMLVFPRQMQAKFVMAWVLLYLSGQHMYNMLFAFGEYKLDITTYTMLLVCKLSALAYCYQDGGVKD